MNTTPDTDVVDDDNLTDAERAALADTEDQQATPAQDPPADPAPADPAPTDPAPTAEDRLASAADKLANAAEALATRATPDPAPAAAAEEEQPAARDFAAELAALSKQYEDGDLDMEAYIEKRDEIRDAQTDARIEARLAEERRLAEESARQRAQADDEAAWDHAKSQFFADPANAALVDNPIKAGAFQAAINEAGKTVQGDYAAMLAKARELVGGAPAATVTDKVKEATFERQQQQPAPGATLRDAPNASGHEAPGAALDNLDIDKLEDAVAAMKPDQLERYLSGAPGGLGDNPRRVD